MVPGSWCSREPLQRAVLRALHGRTVVCRSRADPRRADHRPGSGACPPPRDGPCGADLRAGRHRPLQHGGRDRCRRPFPGRLPQAPRPNLPHRQLRAVLLPPARPRLPGLRDRLRPDRHLHLLRPPLPGGGAYLRGEGRRDRLQPVGHRRGEQSASGSSSNRPTRSTTATSWGRSIGSAAASRTTSRSFSARATSAIRLARSSPRAGAGPRRWSSRIWIWMTSTGFARPGTPTDCTSTAARRRTSSWSWAAMEWPALSPAPGKRAAWFRRRAGRSATSRS